MKKYDTPLCALPFPHYALHYAAIAMRSALYAMHHALCALLDPKVHANPNPRR